MKIWLPGFILSILLMGGLSGCSGTSVYNTWATVTAVKCDLNSNSCKVIVKTEYILFHNSVEIEAFIENCQSKYPDGLVVTKYRIGDRVAVRILKKPVYEVVYLTLE